MSFELITILLPKQPHATSQRLLSKHLPAKSQQ